MTINDELRAMRERVEAATEGPWVPRDLSDAVFDSENDAGWWWVWQESKLPHYGGVLGPDTHGSMDGSIGEASITDARDGHQEKSDATFIAHARTDLPQLLDAVERVMVLHKEVSYGDYTGCLECNTAYYPCRTIYRIEEDWEANDGRA